MENKILIKYGEDCITEINSDTPSLDGLKSFVIEKRDSIDVEKLECYCSTENFDNETFIKAIRESVSIILEKIKINKEQFNDALKTFENN